MKTQNYNNFFSLLLNNAIENGTAPFLKTWQQGEAMLTAPYNPLNNGKYGLMNSLYLRLAGFQDPRWLTAEQANLMGAVIRKNEIARTIRYIKLNEETYILKNNALQKTVNKLDKPQVFFVRVFNAEQIDSLIPLNSSDERIKNINLNNEKIENILKKADIRHKNNGRAFYNSKQDFISIPELNQFESIDDYYATALHEMGHWSGHQNRLNRKINYPFGSMEYSKEKLKVVIYSFILSQIYGISHNPENYLSYVNNWINFLKENPKEIFIACAEAVKIFNYIDGLKNA